MGNLDYSNSSWATLLDWDEKKVPSWQTKPMMNERGDRKARPASLHVIVMFQISIEDSEVWTETETIVELSRET